LSSSPGSGTVFRIYFPRIDEAPAENGNTCPDGQERKTGTETIMVVEDNEQVRNLACRILKSHGYATITARDGGEGLDILTGSGIHVDLLLSDVIMPDINGRDLYERARRKWPDLKVVYMSGYTEDIIASQGVLDNGVDLIRKPFTAQALTEKVREVLDRGLC